MTSSWGDIVWQHEGQGEAAPDTPGKTREAVRTWKAKGVTKVHFRCDDFRILLHHQSTITGDSRYQQMANATSKSAREANIAGAGVEALRKEGLEVQADITIFDEGSPSAVVVGGGQPFPWASRFTLDHPEFFSGYEYAQPVSGSGDQPPEVRARILQALESIPEVAGMTYDCRDSLGLERSNK